MSAFVYDYRWIGISSNTYNMTLVVNQRTNLQGLLVHAQRLRYLYLYGQCPRIGRIGLEVHCMR